VVQNFIRFKKSGKEEDFEEEAVSFFKLYHIILRLNL